jgi:two-component system nitrate/nitrite response regulator NarL
MKKPIQVLVADDHRLFRQGLIALLNTREDLVTVVGEATNGYEAVNQTLRLRPDVVLMDIYMPHLDGMQAAREIHRSMPGISIIMLTSSEQEEHLLEAIRLGACGYLLKTLDADELFELLHCVSKGEAALTRAMATQILRGFQRNFTNSHSDHFTLTEREMDVLYLIASGKSNLEISDELCISVNTVKIHLHNILTKLQVENRTQAAAYAIKAGLVAPTLSEIRNE